MRLPRTPVRNFAVITASELTDDEWSIGFFHNPLTIDIPSMAIRSDLVRSRKSATEDLHLNENWGVKMGSPGDWVPISPVVTSSSKPGVERAATRYLRPCGRL